MLDRFGVPAVVAEPGRNPLEQLAEQVDSIVDADGWDQPFRLFVISIEDVAGMMAYGVREFPLPAGAGHHHPPEVLEILADALSDTPAPRNFAGVALVTEAWMLEVDGKDPVAIEAANAVGAKREVHLHPDRVECRQVSLFVLPGSAVMTNRKRGGRPVVVPAGAVTGAIPQAVRALALTLAGVR